MEDAELEFPLDAVERFPLRKSSRAAWIIQIRSLWLWRCSREMMSRLLIRQTQMSARVAGKMLGAWPGLSRGGGNRRRRQSSPARSTQIDANLLRQGLLKSMPIFSGKVYSNRLTGCGLGVHHRTEHPVYLG